MLFDGQPSVRRYSASECAALVARYAGKEFITVGGREEGDKKHVGGHAVPVDKIEGGAKQRQAEVRDEKEKTGEAKQEHKADRMASRIEAIRAAAEKRKGEKEKPKEDDREKKLSAYREREMLHGGHTIKGEERAEYDRLKKEKQTEASERIARMADADGVEKIPGANRTIKTIDGVQYWLHVKNHDSAAPGSTGKKYSADGGKTWQSHPGPAIEVAKRQAIKVSKEKEEEKPADEPPPSWQLGLFGGAKSIAKQRDLFGPKAPQPEPEFGRKEYLPGQGEFGFGEKEKHQHPDGPIRYTRDQIADLFRYRAEKGHWITLGAYGSEGEKHGGTPVYIEDGQITKGPAALHGKKLGSLGERGDAIGSHRQQMKSGREHAVASLKRKARQAGINTKALEQVAEELMVLDSQVKGERMDLLRDARSMSKNLGYGDISNLKTRISRGHTEEGASLRGFDQIAESMARRYPGEFSGREDHENRLFEILGEGNPELLSEEEAYEQAFERLKDMEETHGKTESEYSDVVPFQMTGSPRRYSSADCQAILARYAWSAEKHPRDRATGLFVERTRYGMIGNASSTWAKQRYADAPGTGAPPAPKPAPEPKKEPAEPKPASSTGGSSGGNKDQSGHEHDKGGQFTGSGKGGSGGGGTVPGTSVKKIEPGSALPKPAQPVGGKTEVSVGNLNFPDSAWTGVEDASRQRTPLSPTAQANLQERKKRLAGVAAPPKPAGDTAVKPPTTAVNPPTTLRGRFPGDAPEVAEPPGSQTQERPWSEREKGLYYPPKQIPKPPVVPTPANVPAPPTPEPAPTGQPGGPLAAPGQGQPAKPAAPPEPTGQKTQTGPQSPSEKAAPGPPVLPTRGFGPDSHNVASHSFSAQEAAAEMNWHSQYMKDRWGTWGINFDNDKDVNAGKRVVTGLMNGSHGAQFAEAMLQGKPAPDPQTVAAVQQELNQVNPGGKNNQLAATALAGAGGNQAPAVVKKLLTPKGKTGVAQPGASAPAPTGAPAAPRAPKSKDAQLAEIDNRQDLTNREKLKAKAAVSAQYDPTKTQIQAESKQRQAEREVVAEQRKQDRGFLRKELGGSIKKRKELLGNMSAQQKQQFMQRAGASPQDMARMNEPMPPKGTRGSENPNDFATYGDWWLDKQARMVWKAYEMPSSPVRYSLFEGQSVGPRRYSMEECERILRYAEFKESEHPRGEGGRFTDKAAATKKLADDSIAELQRVEGEVLAKHGYHAKKLLKASVEAHKPLAEKLAAHFKELVESIGTDEEAKELARDLGYQSITGSKEAVLKQLHDRISGRLGTFIRAHA